MSRKQLQQVKLPSPITSDLDSYGWALYFSGGMLSFSSYKLLALAISGMGLIGIVAAAVTYPKEQGNLLQIKKNHRFFGILLLSTLVCTFINLIGVACLLLGSLLFLYGCFGVKHRAIYLNASIFNPYGTRYSQQTNPFIFGVATVCLLLFGAVLLLFPLWTGQLHQGG